MKDKVHNKDSQIRKELGMDRHFRIFVFVISFMLLICACDEKSTSPKYSDVEDRSFEVGESPTLVIESFVGNITISSGEVGTIRVISTKRDARESDLAKIALEIIEIESALRVTAENPSQIKDVSVDFEITVPLRATMNVGVGVGDIDYEGHPQGICHFNAGVGSITLRLPADVNVKVDLATGVGSIDVDFPVEGHMSNRSVGGTIGAGNEGEIHAHTGVGDIDLVRQ